MSSASVLSATVSVASGQQLGVNLITRTQHVALPARVSLATNQTVTPGAVS